MTSPNGPSPDDAAQTPPSKSLRERIPKRLFGGRLRTTTAVLLIVFVGVLMLYGQRADHYQTIDDEKAAASVARTTAPRTTEDTPAYTEPTLTSSSTRPSSSTSPSDSVDPSVSGSGARVPTTTTTAPPGFQLPTIPGIVLPGQTPTTTPVR